MPVSVNEIMRRPGYRRAMVEKSAIDVEKRTVEIAFSSETEVERWFGMEVLDHSEGSIDFTRLNDGAPYLLNHDVDSQIGVIERAWLVPEEKITRAVVRFSKNALADEVFQDVVDGIRKHVSVGYAYEKVIKDGERNGVPIYRATRWLPFEISQATIPADPNVGVGRALDLSNAPKLDDALVKQIEARGFNEGEMRKIFERLFVENEHQERGRESMPVEMGLSEEEKRKIANEAVESENKRVQDLASLARQYKCEHMLAEALTKKRSLTEFMADILEVNKSRSVDTADTSDYYGIPKKELRRFSLFRVLKFLDSGNRDYASYELEASAQIGKALGRTTSGLFVPTALLARADERAPVNTTTASGVLEDHLMKDEFIPLLKSQTVLSRLGVRWLTGLNGTLSLPKLTKGSMTYWVGEGERPKLSEFDTGQVKMGPRTVSAAIDITKKTFHQTSFDVENLLLNDMTQNLALELERVAFMGDGVGARPLGLFNMPGVEKVGGVDSSLEYADLIDLYTAVASKNVMSGNPAYVTNPLVSGLLKATPMFPNSSMPIWQAGNAPDEGIIAGTRAFESTLIPSDLVEGTEKNLSAIVYGRWSDMIVGTWGLLEVMKDPYTHSLSGDLRLRVSMEVDLAVRYEAAFAIHKAIKAQRMNRRGLINQPIIPVGPGTQPPAG